MPEKIHVPVLLFEAVELLNPKPGGLYIDATFGAGGHARQILKLEPGCTVIGLDWDKQTVDTFAIESELEFQGRLRVVWSNFSQLYRIAKKLRIQHADGILADFGTSWMQLSNRPGFSFLRDTPLDMRMSASHTRVTAADIVNEASHEELCEIFWRYGQERHAKSIASGIVEYRKKKRIYCTKQLVEIVLSTVPASRKSRRIHPATQVFQALRITVNRELDNITAFLPAAFSLLSSGGRLVCITFHSLEDRLVKRFFQEKVALGVAQLPAKAVVPSQQELSENPASRSARLRVLVKI